MTREEFNQIVREDLFRYVGGLGARKFFEAWRYEAGFRIVYLLRLCRYLYESGPLMRPLYFLVRMFLQGLQAVYGVHIDFTMQVGGGLYIPHACQIIINRRAIIGKNFNVSQGVTIGVANRGEKQGNPVIGDRVYIGPGAVVFGKVEIGDDVAIGANAVVTKSFPANSVVVGIPGKAISENGSQGYVNQILDSED